MSVSSFNIAENLRQLALCHADLIRSPNRDYFWRVVDKINVIRKNVEENKNNLNPSQKLDFSCKFQLVDQIIKKQCLHAIENSRQLEFCYIDLTRPQNKNQFLTILAKVNMIRKDVEENWKWLDQNWKDRFSHVFRLIDERAKAFAKKDPFVTVSELSVLERDCRISKKLATEIAETGKDMGELAVKKYELDLRMGHIKALITTLSRKKLKGAEADLLEKYRREFDQLEASYAGDRKIASCYSKLRKLCHWCFVLQRKSAPLTDSERERRILQIISSAQSVKEEFQRLVADGLLVGETEKVAMIDGKETREITPKGQFLFAFNSLENGIAKVLEDIEYRKLDTDLARKVLPLKERLEQEKQRLLPSEKRPLDLILDGVRRQKFEELNREIALLLTSEPRKLDEMTHFGRYFRQTIAELEDRIQQETLPSKQPFYQKVTGTVGGFFSSVGRMFHLSK